MIKEHITIMLSYFLYKFLCVLNDNILLLNHVHVECEAGTYGVNCEESCGDFCEGNMCDHKDGACTCIKWGIGAMCDRIIGKVEIVYILIDSVCIQLLQSACFSS